MLNNLDGSKDKVLWGKKDKKSSRSNDKVIYIKGAWHKFK